MHVKVIIQPSVCFFRHGLKQSCKFMLWRNSVLANRKHFSTLPRKYDPIQESAMAENCILVDNNDRAIGAASKYNCHRVDPKTNAIKLHRAFSVYLFNTAGELLLQRRSREKITFPDTFTNTCCSHPLYDIEEDRIEENQHGVRIAAQRRLNYELGIPLNQIRPEDFHYISRIHYVDVGDKTWGEHEIAYMLILHKDVKITPNPNEVSEFRYVKRSELDDIISKLDAPLTPWFKLIYKNCLKGWWDNLHQLDKVKDHENIIRF